jgi:hypothetical protein
MDCILLGELATCFLKNVVWLYISLWDFFLNHIYCCTGGTQWHLLKFLQHIIIKFTLFIILFYPPFPPIPGTTSILSFFHFHTWVNNISTTFTFLHSFLISSPTHTHWYQLRQNLFYLSVLCFLKKKKTFSFV